MPDEWHDGHLGGLVVDQGHRKAVRVSRSSRRRQMSVIDFDYLIDDGRSTRHVHERHELRLFEWQQYLDAFAAAGLDVHVDDYGLFGRGLIVATPGSHHVSSDTALKLSTSRWALPKRRYVAVTRPIGPEFGASVMCCP